jgi:hypothetical protein
MRTPWPHLVFSFILVLTVGCNLNTNYFSDYSGKSILGNSGFGSGKWVETSGVGNYMTWTAASSDSNLSGLAGFSTGPDGSSPAYRLEIVNLIPDGDFETETAGATTFYNPFWSLASSTVLFATTQNVTGYSLALDNQSAYWLGSAGGDSLTLTLANGSNGALDAFNNAGLLTWGAGAYRFRTDFINATSLNSLQVTLASSQGLTPTTADNVGNWLQNGLAQVSSSSSRVTLSQAFSTTSTEPTSLTVTFGNISSTEYSLLLDNVRMVRTDIDTSVVLTFSSLSSGSLKLLPGSRTGAYTFTVYVQNDPTAVQGSTTPPHAPNRMEPSGLTLTINAAVKSGSGSYQNFYPRSSAWASGWTKLTASLGFDFDDSDSELGGQPALTIKLTPTNTYDLSTGGPDAGSLLVAEPSLVYNP